MNLAVLVLFISSCGDLLNPESDTHTSQIKYHSVLKDQEHSVIMPLKVGNMWIYKVTELNGDGSVKGITFDTTLVRKDTIIDGEKWFITGDPTPEGRCDIICIANTDIGLVQNCLSCPKNNLLLAEYPSKFKTYLFNEEDYPTQLRDYSDTSEISDLFIICVNTKYWYEVVKVNSFITNYGVYDTYKYKLWVESSYINKKNVKVNIPNNRFNLEYYVPDLGLVLAECWDKTSQGLEFIFIKKELIYTNVKI
jgi:hypothetical protein